ncbi:hypothetical protein LPB140_09885 [Sphingorhabdus lutea]|uniref:Phospholipid/glycerol acyltransferase domain-containing protein n=2 Tax=Sphingorhabdus lutea TaxID=1913578 RepID=A0A1L3JF95_9SPHN|nr:hypothetical protein LPB140_09885 [Sphingorhabdus lutea]
MFAARILLLLSSLAICLFLHAIWRLFTPHSPWPRLFLSTVSWNSGVVPKVVGPRIKENVFYASNHISWIDIPTISAATGCTFIAHSGIAEWPLIGWLCRLNNTIFVTRDDRASVAKQIETIQNAMLEKQPITIFPEGTTHDGQSLLPFKPSLFQALVNAPAPILIQPVFLTYGRHNHKIAWLGDEPAPVNGWKILSRIGPATATLHFLEAFDPSQYECRKEIAAEVRRRIGRAMEASRPVSSIV